jgi:hypothetical protein
VAAANGIAPVAASHSRRERWLVMLNLHHGATKKS